MAKKYFIHPLKRWRFERGLTLHEAAKRLKVCVPTIHAIENRKRLPTMRMATRLRDHTGITLDELANAGS